VASLIDLRVFWQPGSVLVLLFYCSSVLLLLSLFEPNKYLLLLIPEANVKKKGMHPGLLRHLSIFFHPTSFLHIRSAFCPFKVIQGHWFWYQSKAHMRLPISPS